ncbi:unnamed protein product [Cyprideis torosa]|uniref:Uncharacterized protein n=1 Tax=Cyprideis torosa TaxID=163714 RepID=A0A7R8WX25_9CRUS|nr:unnamed protein product [Cyprideis torosa]CAG0907621.1 unnamed protein product [Cyprideis torosa]
MSMLDPGSTGSLKIFMTTRKICFLWKCCFHQERTRCLQPSQIMEEKAMPVGFVVKSSSIHATYEDTSEVTLGRNLSAVPCVLRRFRGMNTCGRMNNLLRHRKIHPAECVLCAESAFSTTSKVFLALNLFWNFKYSTSVQQSWSTYSCYSRYGLHCGSRETSDSD